MLKIVEITPVTLKRVMNYQRVVDAEMKKADQTQWMEMTWDRMQEYKTAWQKADQVGAAAAYAGFLFRVQSGSIPYRTLYGEHLLRNILVGILNELHIAVHMVEVPDYEALFVLPDRWEIRPDGSRREELRPPGAPGKGEFP